MADEPAGQGYQRAQASLRERHPSLYVYEAVDKALQALAADGVTPEQEMTAFRARHPELFRKAEKPVEGPEPEL